MMNSNQHDATIVASAVAADSRVGRCQPFDFAPPLPSAGDFVSELLTPCAGLFETRAMGRGEPGLPPGFRWRGGSYTVVQALEQWKESSPEGGRAAGELYLRRHYWRLRMADGSIWTVYFTRQAPKNGSPRARWFLYSTERTPILGN